jgi:hypothetical protein
MENHCLLRSVYNLLKSRYGASYNTQNIPAITKYIEFNPDQNASSCLTCSWEFKPKIKN